MTGSSDATGPADAEDASDGSKPSTPPGRPWAPWALGAAGTLLAVVLILVAARPDWIVRAWDSTGIDCGRGLSQGDPQDVDVLQAAWGQAEHEPHDGLDVDDHRAHIEELARQLDAEPVGEIPRQSAIEAEGSQDVDVEVESQGELIRADVRGDDGLRRIAAIDPSTAETAWQWDLDEGRDNWVQEHGEHLILANRIVRGSNVFVGDLWTDMLSLDATTGERQGCHRFEGFPGYGAGSTDAGLVVGTESWNPMVADEEQEVGTRTIQQVSVPEFSQGFSRALAEQEYETTDGHRTRPQPLVTLPGGFFLTYASSFTESGYDAFTSARSDIALPSDPVPVEAFSMDTGEPLWSYGEPGDRIAFVSGVHGLPGDAAGVLLAELGEFEPSEADPERGSSSVTLRLLDAQGEQLWEAQAADIGAGAFSGASDSERYLRILGDVILVHTAPHVVTALDAATGEELWNIDEDDAEPQSLYLMEAVAVDGKLFLPGSGREYMVDARTGEHDDELAAAMADARVLDITAVGEDMLLVETRAYGYMILQKR